MTSPRFGRRRGANKFGASKTADGFPSLLERAVFFKLKDREVLGLVRNIERQQTVVLQEGRRDTRIALKVDFKFEEALWPDAEKIDVERRTITLGPVKWRVVYAEAKGFETKDWKIKLKLWRAKMPAPLEIWKGNWRSPKLAERIETKQVEEI